MGCDLGNTGDDGIFGRANQQNCGNSVFCRQNDLRRRMHMMGQGHIACAGIQEREYRKTVRGPGKALDDQACIRTDDTRPVIDRAEHGIK